MYIVYVLYSEVYDKTYTGMTSNIEERFKSHNELGKKGWDKKLPSRDNFLSGRVCTKTNSFKKGKVFKKRSWQKVYPLFN